MQPLRSNLGCPAAKNKSITHAAAASSNMGTAITMRSAETALQNTKELRTMPSNFAAVLLRSAMIALQIRLQLPWPSQRSTTWMQPLQCDLRA